MNNEKYKIYSSRWLVLFAFCTFTYFDFSFQFRFSNALGFVQYAPIISLASQFYGIKEQQVTWFSNCYYITYVMFCFLSIKPLEQRLDLSLYLAAFIATLGHWLKYFAGQTYSLALIGVILIGIGQIFILAAPAYISDRWFPVHERTISTSLGSFCNLAGLNFSIAYASITFKNVVNEDEIITEINFMNLLYSIISTTAFVVCVLMIRHKPPSPPSVSATAEKMLIVQSFFRAFSSLENIMDLMTFSVFIGVSWAYLAVISILLAPFHYSNLQIGYVSIVFAATGAIGGTIASIYVDYQIQINAKPNYDFLIKGFLTTAVVGIVIQTFLIQHVNYTVIVIFAGVIGFGLNSFLPLALQCYIEKLFPSFELVLITVMMQMSNLFGFILNYILIQPIFTNVGLLVILVTVIPFYIYLMLKYQTKFVRWELEQIQQGQNVAQIEDEPEQHQKQVQQEIELYKIKHHI